MILRWYVLFIGQSKVYDLVVIFTKMATSIQKTNYYISIHIVPFYGSFTYFSQ